ncbi:MAG TPA: O-antigen ligase family protein, partial [Solirubrobacterales bacterium]|nr:O-antigen ligase family protein [Solirubrobacterales bacterium]
WTDSADRTFADLARVLTYLGVFVLAVLLRNSRGARRVVAGVGAAVAVIAAVALLSRMRPGAFPEAAQTALFLGGAQERLSFPLDYWNGLAGLIAMGLPLVLQMASSARSAITRGLAAGALPGLMLAASLTLSRGGIAAAVLGLLVFLAFASDRLPKLASLALAGAGGAALILIAAGHEAFRHGLGGGAARSEGDEMLVATVLVCLAVGLAQAAVSAALRDRRRPRWLVASPRQTWIATCVGVLAMVVVALALGAPGRAADGWEEFKGKAGPGEGSARLASAAGENRYQYWSATLDQNATRPLSGTGSGTFELWWNRHGNGSIVRDAHSLYMQTLGELGIVGVGLLVAFLLVVLGGGARRVLGAERRARSQLAAALGGCAAFCLTAAFDWTWQLPVLPVAFMLLASALLTAGARSRRAAEGAFPVPARAGFAVLALVAIAAIAISLASTSLVRESQSEAREGDLSAALDSARTAVDVRPGGGAAHLQEALVLERLGRLGPAAKAAGEAADREPKDWQPWFVLSRLYAEQGRVGDALEAYRRARLLDRNSILLGLPS